MPRLVSRLADLAVPTDEIGAAFDPIGDGVNHRRNQGVAGSGERGTAAHFESEREVALRIAVGIHRLNEPRALVRRVASAADKAKSTNGKHTAIEVRLSADPASGAP